MGHVHPGRDLALTGPGEELDHGGLRYHGATYVVVYISHDLVQVGAEWCDVYLSS